MSLIAHKYHFDVTPSGWAAIRAVYQHALEIGSKRGQMKGNLTLGGICALTMALFCSYFSTIVFRSDIAGKQFSALRFEDFSFLLLVLFGTLFCFYFVFVFLRADLFTYRENPVLFNRKTRKLHVFRHHLLLKKPFSHWPVIIDTYDWDCARPAVTGGAMMIGTNAATVSFDAILEITDAPGSDTVIDRIQIGPATGSKDTMLQLWEHIRQYMDEGGRPMQEHNEFSRALWKSHRDILGSKGIRLLKPHLLDRWRRAPFKESLLILYSVIFAPFCIFWALADWAAMASCKDPQWPDDILADAGARIPNKEVLARWSKLPQLYD